MAYRQSRANALGYFCLAMSYRHLEDEEVANKWYKRGIEEQKARPNYYSIPHWPAEAETLMGIKVVEAEPLLP